MSFVHWFAIAAFAAAPAALAGQEKRQQPDPADPAAEVASFTYRSAFSGYQPARDEQESPDKTWRAANEEIGRLGGHAEHIKGSAAVSPAPGSVRTVTSGSLGNGKHHWNKGIQQ